MFNIKTHLYSTLVFLFYTIHTLFKSKNTDYIYYTHSKMVFLTHIALLVASAAAMVSAGPAQATVLEAARSIDYDTRSVTDSSDPKLQKRNGLLYCGHFPSTPQLLTYLFPSPPPPSRFKKTKAVLHCKVVVHQRQRPVRF